MISLSRPYQETVDCPRLGACPWLGVFSRRLFSFRVNTYLDNYKHLIIFFLLRSLKRDKIYMLQQVQAFGATPQPSGLGAILLRWQFFFSSCVQLYEMHHSLALWCTLFIHSLRKWVGPKVLLFIKSICYWCIKGS